MDWNSVFSLSVPVSELVLRGSLMYLSLFLILRFLRRQSGAMSLSDLLLIVLIADAAQNGLSGDYKSIPEGLIVVATIVLWDVVLDLTAFRIPALRHWLKPPALNLVEDSEPVNRNLKRQMIDQEELLGHLRLQGVDKLDEVKLCVLEGNGHISVIRRPKGA